MSKSLGNYIGISEPAEVMFEKCMKVPDALLPDYFRLTTDVPEKTCARLCATDIRQAHFAYALEIVRMYHGGEAAAQAERRYVSVASGKTPDSMEVVAVHAKEASVIELLKQAGFAASGSEARRLIEGRGVKLDGETVEDIRLIVQNDAVLSCGKSRFVRVCFHRIE
jgi:tyrosyl-tRNA synthetase